MFCIQLYNINDIVITESDGINIDIKQNDGSLARLQFEPNTSDDFEYFVECCCRKLYGQTYGDLQQQKEDESREAAEALENARNDFDDM